MPQLESFAFVISRLIRPNRWSYGGAQPWLQLSQRSRSPTSEQQDGAHHREHRQRGATARRATRFGHALAGCGGVSLRVDRADRVDVVVGESLLQRLAAVLEAVHR